MKSPIPAFIFILAVFPAAPMAQPQAFSYQALVRDGGGAAVRNQAVGMRIRLHYDSANTAYSYAETFNPTSNGYGNVNLSIGRGIVVSGTFATLDWSRPMFVEIGVDPNGGTAYVDLGTTQLLSVPYAMYSGRSGTSSAAPVSNEIRDADSNTKVSTERAANENVIRFDLNGTEKMRLRANSLEFLNNGQSVFLGENAGNGDDLSNNQNVFVGALAGQANSTGTRNTFSGFNAGAANTTANYNTFTGAFSGFNTNQGIENVFMGNRSGYLNTTGNGNTFIGTYAGYYNTTGNGNTYLGRWAGGSDFSNSADSFNVFIGANVEIDGSNQLAIDNSNTTTPLIRGDFLANTVTINGSLSATGTITPSDRRLKEKFEPLSNALEGVGRLSGMYYRYKKDSEGIYPQGRQIGVIAQDVEKVYPELVGTTSNGYKAVDYPKLTAVLIEAVKEQQKTIVDLKDRVRMLESKQGLARQ